MESEKLLNCNKIIEDGNNDDIYYDKPQINIHKEPRMRHASTPNHSYHYNKLKNEKRSRSNSLSNLPKGNILESPVEVKTDDSSSDYSDKQPYECIKQNEEQSSNDTYFNPSIWQKCFVMFVLTFTNILNYMDRYTVAGVLSQIENHFFGHIPGEHHSQLGLLQTAFFISYMIFSPIFGFLGDRYNRKFLMIIGIVFWSAITFISSFVTQTYIKFLMMRALVGIGEASYSTIAPTIIADYFIKGARSKMLAVFYLAIPAGSGLGYVLSSLVAKATGNWTWSLCITPILGFICIVLMFFIQIPKRGAAEGGSHIKATPLIDDLKYLMVNYSFMFSTLGFASVAFIAGSLSLWGPYYLVKSSEVNHENGIQGQLSKENINLLFGVCTCVTGVIGVAIGVTAAKYFRRWTKKSEPLVCAFGLIVAAPTIFIVIYLSRINVPLTWIFLVIGETALSLNWSIVTDILLCVVVPTRRAMAEALQILIAHALGDAGSPFLIGAIADKFKIPLRNSSLTNSTSTFIAYKSIQYSMYINCLICIIGAIFFCLTAHFIVKDKKAVDDVTGLKHMELEIDCTEATFKHSKVV